MLLLSTFAVLSKNLIPKVNAPNGGGAELTGNIFDEGIDTDADGLFNSLQIGVEINVTAPATYQISVQSLYGTVWVNVGVAKVAFLYPGVQTVNVSLNGSIIYASHGNISAVHHVGLSVFYEGYYYPIIIDSIYDHLLNKTYSYTEFDPYAFFTGTILAEGIEEDGDALYDYLKISIEVNVTDAGLYEIQFNNLVGNYSDYISEYQSFQSELGAGLHFINFTIYGPKIYNAHVNPVYVGEIWLLYAMAMGESSWIWIVLEQRHMVPLSAVYNYTEFESHAFLTGNIYDSVADTDSDGLWDYLEVGVEVNVTEAGEYLIYIAGLAEKLNGGNDSIDYHYLWNIQHSIANLSIGIHIINFTFSGPLIAYNHFNPTNASDIELFETSTSSQLSYVNMASLSRRYNWTEFDPPLNDMQLEFTVYPDATVGVSGLFNFTHVFSPYYSSPLLANVTTGFSTIGNLTTGSAYGIIVLPEEVYMLPYYVRFHEFPFNSTTINFASQYNNGMLNANLDATVDLPPEGRIIYPFNSSNLSLHGTYSNGILNIDLYGETTLPSFIAAMFPLNITDVTIMADYSDNELNGNITFHTPLSSFPLSDVIVHFNGNKTEISFNGYANVIYGDWFGMKINQTILEEMLSAYNSTIPGQGEGSLYNMTMGMVECTRLNTTMTPFGPDGARVDYNITIHGNFTQLMAHIIAGMYGFPEESRSLIEAVINATLSSVDHASLTFDYYHVTKVGFLDLTLISNVTALWSNALQLIPPRMPPELRNQTEAFLKIANITAYAVEDVLLDMDYSSVTQQLNIHASLTANVTRMKDEIIPILPEIVPPQLKDFVESCTNTTYCKLNSLNVTCNYANGVIDFDAEWLLDGDFTAELNRIKSCYILYLNLTSPWMINWQMLMLNATEIDISNFNAELRQGKIGPCEYWTTFQFEGVKVRRVKDEIDPIRFKLYRLFNSTTSSYESPREFEKLKITIIGASDTNRTVLLYAPPTIPNPDYTSLDYRVMIWQNTSLSSVKDLQFNIASQQVINYYGTHYVPIFTNSTISEFAFNPDPTAPSISFKVSGATGTKGFCNITIPRALINVITGNWTVKINGRALEPEEFILAQNDEYVFIYLNYTHSEHIIEIVGTWVVKEIPTNMLLPILMMLTLMAAIIAIKQRKKLSRVKAKYQSAISTLAKQLRQSRA